MDDGLPALPTLTWADFWADQKRRFPRPEDLLPTPWLTPLLYRKGQDRLKNLPVYFDFNWEEVFGHRRNTFPNGQSLSGLVKKECPDGKHPALLLTVRDDVDERPIVTQTHFIVVVNIKNYLERSSADSATSYFARITTTQITGLSRLKELVSTPEGLEVILPLLNGDAIKNWAHDNSEALHELAEITATSGFQELLKVLTVDDVSKILEWAVDPSNPQQAIEIVDRLRAESLPTLYTLTGIARLRQALATWNLQKENSDEEHWQTFFRDNSFILSQLFSFPVVILKGKAYIGGKGIENTGGNVVDYLLANQFTGNALLGEIKTPKTPILGALYRGDIYNVSSDLSGAVQQASNYKQQLLQHYFSLVSCSKTRFHAFDPPCLVIAGSTTELDSDIKIKSFELYRNGLKDIQVVTFDELFAKLTTLANLLDGTDQGANGQVVVPPAG